MLGVERHGHGRGLEDGSDAHGVAALLEVARVLERELGHAEAHLLQGRLRQNQEALYRVDDAHLVHSVAHALFATVIRLQKDGHEIDVVRLEEGPAVPELRKLQLGRHFHQGHRLLLRALYINIYIYIEI